MRLFKWLRNTFYGPVTKSDMGPLDNHGQFEESRYKVMYNPFVDKFMWCQLDTNTHIWDWIGTASHKDIHQWFKESEQVQKYGFPVSDLLLRMSDYTTNIGEPND